MTWDSKLLIMMKMSDQVVDESRFEDSKHFSFLPFYSLVVTLVWMTTGIRLKPLRMQLVVVTWNAACLVLDPAPALWCLIPSLVMNTSFMWLTRVVAWMVPLA